ncbi:hypothetical protein GCM10009007_04500 [Formosimonas limnophila]|uniref:LysM domain-containing protein n=1 Tax=Formosimonas limnophila TaxID=1384487 RepID=A0A8J3CLU4_9BURK|nr:transglycosylase SLT domain-containing protein [Formosimonas limnophila]GHA67036.1 hypothetical protein GCM10009007_04500 [Formosimonas limnophila]
MLKKLFTPKIIANTLNRLFSHPANKLVVVSIAAILTTACTTTSNTRNNGSYNANKQASSKDIWQRVRNGYKIPDLYNEEVTKKENYYAQRADYVGRMASRSGDFMYLIMNEVERRNMPSELALLPFVESAFVTNATSPVKASGLWQFMPATGRDFSLQQNHYADQRNDVVASTDAALTYLQRLYDMFGDWHLALAAYNWGQGNVSKAVKRNIASGGSGSYTEIKMPLETRQYVPKLQAIKNIVNNPALYGISLPPVENNLRHETVTVTRDIDVSTAAELSGMSLDEFKRINPAHKKPVIVAALGNKILVPANQADDIRRAFSDHSRKIASLTTYLAYNAEALSDIASRYKTSTENLRALNNIPQDHDYVKAGSALLVPRLSALDDIPYQALTAGLSTTSSGFGLSTDYIEQTSIAANTSNDTALPKNNDFVTPSKSGTSFVTIRDNQQNDTLGSLIQNSPRLTTPTIATNSVVKPIENTTPATITASASNNNTAQTTTTGTSLSNTPQSLIADNTSTIAPQTNTVTNSSTITSVSTATSGGQNTLAPDAPLTAANVNNPETAAQPVASVTTMPDTIVNITSVAENTNILDTSLTATKSNSADTSSIQPILVATDNTKPATTPNISTQLVENTIKVNTTPAPAKFDNAPIADSGNKTTTGTVVRAKYTPKPTKTTAPKTSSVKKVVVSNKETDKAPAQTTKPKTKPSAVQKPNVTKPAAQKNTVSTTKPNKKAETKVVTANKTTKTTTKDAAVKAPASNKNNVVKPEPQKPVTASKKPVKK